MANEIKTHYTAGLNLYAVIVDKLNQFWTTAGGQFEAYNGGNWANYDIGLTGVGAGYYSANFPAIPAAGAYSILLYQRLGGIPATTDTPLGVGTIEWSGAAEAPLYSVLVDGKPLPIAVAIIAALAAGKASGVAAAGPNQETYTGLDGATPRAIIDIDATGNRTGANYP